VNNIFLYDKNIITYQNLIDYVNSSIIEKYYSDLEIFILESIKNLSSYPVSNIDDLLSKIISNNNKILLNTSGTTGKPKDVSHTINTITKNIIIDKKYGDVCWGLTYNQGKMAFYQVLLQSLFNKSKIVNLYGYSFDDMSDRIIENKITHISATPTFYRMLISSKIIFKDIKQITLGGEGSDSQFIDKLKVYFPNARVKNVYASTETASLFASDNDIFKIPEKYLDKVKFINNTLLIHKDLLGNIDNTPLNDEWYDTQDEVEFISENKFKFIGRKNIEINVSGFKVNPLRVESIINSLPYVVNSVVYSKKNSVVGSLLCCDLILNKPIDKSTIKSELKNIIDKHEIPVIINIVDTIKINDNMKISRS
jgi:acyl-coenzyme A synthetase/AMP-(fatty) acid ligase